ncbi:MAG: sel1 repeat family protein [Methylococcaceae bacterium]|nr:sel1 repeat family protein [Methylococcaceae bacterium]
MAEHYYDGDDDYIQDYEEAMKLYKQAIKLGCLLAYKKIGDMYLYGFGVSASDKKALDWYKVRSKKGNYYCYTSMAGVFWRGDKTDNFHKCFKLYFKNKKEQPNKIIEDFYYFVCDSYITRCFQWDMTPLVEVIEESSENKRSIILSLTSRIEYEVENNGKYI